MTRDQSTTAPQLRGAGLTVRYWTKVLCGLTPDDCWEWLGATQSHGYGHLGRGGRGTGNIRAHVLSFLLHGGVLTSDKPKVLHHCDNPPCTNPRHLFAGTQKDNVQDMIDKGRQGIPSVHGADHPLAKLTAEQVAIIRAEYVPRKTPLRVFAERFGVSLSAVHLALRHKTYR